MSAVETATSAPTAGVITPPASAQGRRHLNLAILAMGGEGGGVLADWIVDMAEHAGWRAQSTSVPGVAQRTGATIYYVEMHRPDPADGDGDPILALAPFPGDVDVVIASELMEAGRAIQRGLVTPDRTTLIASSHRVYSMTEKTAMGDGRVDAQRILQSCRDSAHLCITGDFALAAQEADSVISASLFGALAASGALPFTRADFESAVQRAGIGVASSLKGMAAGAALAQAPAGAVEAAAARGSSRVGTQPITLTPATAAAAAPVGPVLEPLVDQARQRFPAAAQDIVQAGIRRLADYQDPAYAREYLQRLDPIAALDTQPDAQLLRETARHLALWMSYEDTIRVADLKTRPTRFDRVAREVRVGSDQLLAIQEFLHPRVEEIADMLPAGPGRWLLRTRWARGFVGLFTRQGRVVRTSSLPGFLMLYLVAGMRGWRRRSLRHQVEHARIDTWLAQVQDCAAQDRELAIAVAQCQRLVKGYSDTHVRGVRHFETVMAALPQVRRQPSPAAALRSLCEAALADEGGQALRQALSRHAPEVPA